MSWRPNVWPVGSTRCTPIGNWLKRGHRNRDGIQIVTEGRFRYNLYFAYYAAIAPHHTGGSIWHRTYAKPVTSSSKPKIRRGQSARKRSW